MSTEQQPTNRVENSAFSKEIVESIQKLLRDINLIKQGVSQKVNTRVLNDPTDLSAQQAHFEQSLEGFPRRDDFFDFVDKRLRESLKEKFKFESSDEDFDRIHDQQKENHTERDDTVGDLEKEIQIAETKFETETKPPEYVAHLTKQDQIDFRKKYFRQVDELTKSHLKRIEAAQDDPDQEGFLNDEKRFFESRLVDEIIEGMSGSKLNETLREKKAERDELQKEFDGEKEVEDPEFTTSEKVKNKFSDWTKNKIPGLKKTVKYEEVSRTRRSQLRQKIEELDSEIEELEKLAATQNELAGAFPGNESLRRRV
jgi:hypothetical protein